MIEVTIWAALIAGLISFASPCVLSMVPSYLFAMSQNKTRAATLFNALAFVVGFTVVFVGLGALAGLFSFYTLQKIPWTVQIAGIVIIAFGIFMILSALDVKWVNKVFPFLSREKRFQVGTGNKSPLRFGLFGLAFGFGWTPCIGPTLSTIIALAYTGQTAGKGAFLLAVYSMGLGIPFLLSAVFAGFVTKFIRKMGKFYTVVEVAGGLIIIGLGLIMATNNIFALNAWFYKIIS